MISYIDTPGRIVPRYGLNVKISCFITKIYANVCFLKFILLNLISGRETILLRYYITVN